MQLIRGLYSMNFLDIRNCTKEDLSAVKYIYNTCMKEISCAYIPYTMETLQDFYKIKVEKKEPFLVATYQGEVVAFTTYTLFIDWFMPIRTIDYGIYVKKSARGKGIAKQLIHILFILAYKQGYRMANACIDFHNVASIRMHEKMGFHCIGSFNKQSKGIDYIRKVLIYQKELII